MTTLEQIDKPILSEALTLSAIIALTSGYEQDDKVRIPKLADLAKQNGLEGLVDPVTGNYVSNEGDEDDEVPFEIAEKLSAAGLLPKNARLAQAGWFDNNRVFDTANKNLLSQSSSVAERHELIMAKLQLLKDLAKQIIAFRDKRATAKMQDVIGEKPILPSNAPSPELARLTPTFPSQTMAGMNESAGLADALIESFEYLYEESWKDSPLPGIKKRSSTVVPDDRAVAGEFGSISRKQQPWSPTATTQGMQDTNWLGKQSNAPQWTAPSNSTVSEPTDTPKPAASKNNVMDVNKFGKAGGEYSKIKGIPLAKDLMMKAGAKSASKFWPGVGVAYGAADAAQRFANKDYTGAGISGLSTITSQIPGPAGMGVTLGLDGYNLYRDMEEDERLQAQAEKEQAEKDATPTEPTKEAPPAEPTKEAPPVKPTRNDPVTSTKNFQTYLKSLGANLGKTGPNRDGIDGVVGPLTKAAIAKYILNGK